MKIVVLTSNLPALMNVVNQLGDGLVQPTKNNNQFVLDGVQITATVIENLQNQGLITVVTEKQTA